MPNQEQSRTGKPEKDQDRPSPDVSQESGGQGKAADAGAPQGQDYRGDGPAKIGLTSDEQPDLVAPSGVNERDHGAADDKPMGGGALNFDDDPEERPRGNVTGRNGRTWEDKNPSDAGKLGAPGAGLSDRNGPSDPDAKRGR